jgi:hypothetical protein
VAVLAHEIIQVMANHRHGRFAVIAARDHGPHDFSGRGVSVQLHAGPTDDVEPTHPSVLRCAGGATEALSRHPLDLVAPIGSRRSEPHLAFPGVQGCVLGKFTSVEVVDVVL